MLGFGISDVEDLGSVTRKPVSLSVCLSVCLSAVCLPLAEITQNLEN
jgi:hypothetical protein